MINNFSDLINLDIVGLVLGEEIVKNLKDTDMLGINCFKVSGLIRNCMTVALIKNKNVFDYTISDGITMRDHLKSLVRYSPQKVTKIYYKGEMPCLDSYLDAGKVEMYTCLSDYIDTEYYVYPFMSYRGGQLAVVGPLMGLVFETFYGRISEVRIMHLKMSTYLWNIGEGYSDELCMLPGDLNISYGFLNNSLGNRCIICGSRVCSCFQGRFAIDRWSEEEEEDTTPLCARTRFVCSSDSIKVKCFRHGRNYELFPKIMCTCEYTNVLVMNAFESNVLQRLGKYLSFNLDAGVLINIIAFAYTRGYTNWHAYELIRRGLIDEHSGEIYEDAIQYIVHAASSYDENAAMVPLKTLALTLNVSDFIERAPIMFDTFSDQPEGCQIASFGAMLKEEENSESDDCDSDYY